MCFFGVLCRTLVLCKWYWLDTRCRKVDERKGKTEYEQLVEATKHRSFRGDGFTKNVLHQQTWGKMIEHLNKGRWTNKACNEATLVTPLQKLESPKGTRKHPISSDSKWYHVPFLSFFFSRKTKKPKGRPRWLPGCQKTTAWLWCAKDSRGDETWGGLGSKQRFSLKEDGFSSCCSTYR